MWGNPRIETFTDEGPGRVLSSKFHLELHPEKARVIEFGRHAARRRSKRGEGPPETFDFLGFTHISGKTQKGYFAIRRISALKKLKAKLKELKDKLKRMVHWDLADVGAWLSSVYKGWCSDHAVPLNSTRLNQFRTAIQQIWLRVPRRRSQRAHRMTWAEFGKLCRRWLPNPKILHSYPNERFARRVSEV